MIITKEVLKIILDHLKEKGLIKVLNNLTEGRLEIEMKEINKELNGAIKKTHASGNDELDRQSRIGLS